MEQYIFVEKNNNEKEHKIKKDIYMREKISIN